MSLHVLVFSEIEARGGEGGGGGLVLPMFE